MDLIIKPERAYISCFSEKGAFDLGSTNCAIGNIIVWLGAEFPEVCHMNSKEYAALTIKRIMSYDSERYGDVCGLRILRDEAYSIISFADDLGGEYKISLFLQDVEMWRVRHHVDKAVTPGNWLDVSFKEGLTVNNVASHYEVIYGLLYYYAFNGLKLVKCEHCGRWFATDSLKNKYCTRKSPIERYTHLNCEQAVQNIRQQCGRIRNRIDMKARQTRNGEQFQEWFWSQCNRRNEEIKKSASVERLTEYMAFLKKTEREKGWLNNAPQSF